MSQTWCVRAPMAATRKPPPQQQAAATPALRGPTRSIQRPNTAADDPRKKMAMEKVRLTVLTFQSSGAGCVMPMVWLSGFQKTLRPYAIPIDRCMASAAGGTSQRLKPGPAICAFPGQQSCHLWLRTWRCNGRTWLGGMRAEFDVATGWTS